MGKQITYLTLFILACYSQSAFCEWIKVKSEDERVVYIDDKITGKYWIRNYRVMQDYMKPKVLYAVEPNVSFSSIVQLKTLDCLFGNAANRAIGFYSGSRATGKRHSQFGRGFGLKVSTKRAYDYRWFQFNREYDDEVFEYVCGDLYTLKDQNLFRKIPRQSPM
jgi:hypothetical protein